MVTIIIHLEKCSSWIVFSHRYVAAMSVTWHVHKSQANKFKHVHVHQKFEYCTEATFVTSMDTKAIYDVGES